MQTLFWILLGIFVVVYLLEIVLRRRITKTLNKLLEEGAYKEFDILRNSKLTMYVVSKVNLRYMDMTKAILQSDTSIVNKCLERFDKMALTNRQKEDIYCRAFFYYLSKHETNGCKKTHDKVMSLNDSDSKAEIDLMYHVYIEKDDLYLEDLLKTVDDLDPKTKAGVASMISEIYKNKGDKESADKYMKISTDCLKESD